MPFGEPLPLDDTTDYEDPLYAEYGDFYATGICVNDTEGIVIVAWSTDGSTEAPVIWNARAVRWTEDLVGEIGPMLDGPPAPSPGWDIRLNVVAKLSDNYALIVPGSGSPAGYVDTLGFIVSVDPGSLVLTYHGTLAWPGGVSPEDWGQAVPGEDRLGLREYVSGVPRNLGFVSISRDSHAITNSRFWTETDPDYDISNWVDLGDQFLGLYYPPDNTNVQLVVYSDDAGVPGGSMNVVQTLEHVFIFDAVFTCTLDDGHVLIYGQRLSSPFSGILYTVNPADWSYTYLTLARPQRAGLSGHLQDYMSVQPDPGLNRAIFGYIDEFLGSGNGEHVGLFDGTNVIFQELIFPWRGAVEGEQQGMDSVHSVEVWPCGLGRYICTLNGSMYETAFFSSKYTYGQIWAICGITFGPEYIEGALESTNRRFTKGRPNE